MALPSSGAISLSQANTELGLTSTATISLNDSGVRGLAGVASGAISMDNLHGKSNVFSATLSSDQADLNLRTWALANGWNGSTAAVITVASGVYIYSTSTANAGLTIDGSWPGGVTVVNNGYIMGMGGRGANQAGNSATPPGNGGPAINLGVNCAITNNSYIGGGGGGGGATYNSNQANAPGGGGAGGGAGGDGINYNNVVNYGGAGGAPGAAGADGTAAGFKGSPSGGGGGRIMPGTGGASQVNNTGTQAYPGGLGGGAGGSGAGSNIYFSSGAGGSGGDAGGNGTLLPGATQITYVGGGGGGWGASGGTGVSGYGHPTLTPGTGGKCVALNGYSVTWNVTGTRYGAIA